MRAVVDGGLESVLDEHFWLRAQNLPEGSAGLAADLEQSIGLRAGGFSLHTLARNPEKIPVRCHVAVPFGDAEAEPVSRKGGEAITSTPARPDEVRRAFNTPFWPHVPVVVRDIIGARRGRALRSEEHTSELQSLMRISYAVF